MLKPDPKKRLKLTGETLSVVTERKLSNDDLRRIRGGLGPSIFDTQTMN